MEIYFYFIIIIRSIEINVWIDFCRFTKIFKLICYCKWWLFSMSLSHFIVAALIRIYSFRFHSIHSDSPKPRQIKNSHCPYLPTHKCTNTLYFNPVHWSSIRTWNVEITMTTEVCWFFKSNNLFNSYWTAMDLKCNCFNCQNASSQGAIGTGPQFDSNKRYETYGNVNTSENQVFNIPERQCKWFWIEL